MYTHDDDPAARSRHTPTHRRTGNEPDDPTPAVHRITEMLPIVQAPPRPRMGGRGPAIIGLALLGVCVIAFAAVLIVLRVLPDPFESAAEPLPVTTVTPSAAPRTARFAQPGDCVANTGTEEDPDLVMAPCESGALQVLARFDATSDTRECKGVQGYRYHYFFDSELAGLDFVLCMGKRP
ncbi:LppU/SCO3897 family protein [Catellatospora tritici]|uniref:LppU/SCO3897 family protein n=1 Tax=Catellatospora tritici TaxID=2851566 RepID=UPI001C2D9616|nr:hypothetical protein [Catellatospora tritici]MBV1852180.1 hypothetical protein [Catellatospora tritici]